MYAVKQRGLFCSGRLLIQTVANCLLQNMYIWINDLTLFQALTGGAFNWQQSREYDRNFSKKSNAPGFAQGGGGGMGGFGIDRYIIGINMCPNQLIQFAFEHFPNPIINSIITRFSTKIKCVKICIIYLYYMSSGTGDPNLFPSIFLSRPHA